MKEKYFQKSTEKKKSNYSLKSDEISHDKSCLT